MLPAMTGRSQPNSSRCLVKSIAAVPVILRLVADGSVTLTTVTLLGPHLTPENHEALLEGARHKSKREVEYQIACLSPQPDIAPMVRRLPARSPVEIEPMLPAPLISASQGPSGSSPVAPSVSPPPRSMVAPLASDRFLLRVTLSAETHAKLRRAQQLMGHSLPDGNPAAILDEALSLLVVKLERTKIGRVRRPRAASQSSSPSSSGSRHIPAEVRRQVWEKDDGRCAFVGPSGRCAETSGLEFHHLVPFARGGPTIPANLELRCRAHNAHESERAVGPRPQPRGRTNSGPSSRVR